MEKQIIVGIASLPDRVECLKDTIDSLLPQVDKIIVGLNNYESIPEFLNNPKIEAYLLDNSLGDAAKFLKIDEYPNAYYFACDDDLIYPSNYTENLIQKTNEYGVPVGLHGAILRKPITSMYIDRIVFHCLKAVTSDITVDYLGTGALCYDTSKLSVKIDYFKEPNMADIWFGDIMNKNNIKPVVISHDENYLTYNSKMQTKWTIFDEYVKTRNDIKQTQIASQW